MAILTTGGAGYIGSHTCIELTKAGYDVIVVDNLDNSSEKSLERVEKIVGKKIKFYKEDVRDREAMRKIFTENNIEAVILVMRESQKGIIIGPKGMALKRVGIQARKDMEKFFEKKVFLKMFVKVDPDWRENKRELKKFGYIQ